MAINLRNLLEVLGLAIPGPMAATGGTGGDAGFRNKDIGFERKPGFSPEMLGELANYTKEPEQGLSNEEDIMALLRSAAPSTASKEPGFKQTFLKEILPALIAGGAGAAFGGGIGAGSALENFGKHSLARKELEQRREEAQGRTSQQQLEAALRYIAEQNRARTRAETAATTEAATERRHKETLKARSEEAEAARKGQRELAEFQSELEMRPATVSPTEIIAGTQAVPRRFLGQAITETGAGHRAQKEREFREAESEVDRTWREDMQRLAQEFQAKQQRERIGAGFEQQRRQHAHEIAERDREHELKAQEVMKTKPLSGEAAKVYGISETLPTDIDKIKEAFGYDSQTKTVNQGKYKRALSGYLLGTDRPLVRLIQNAADKVGRLRSGGAINKEEETRFVGQFAALPDLTWGKVGAAIESLDTIKNESGLVRESLEKGIVPKGGQVTPGVTPLKKKSESDPGGFFK